MMAQLNELSTLLLVLRGAVLIVSIVFRIGVFFAQDPAMQDPNYLNEHMDEGWKNVSYSVTGTRIDEVTVYSSDLRYFAGAAGELNGQ